MKPLESFFEKQLPEVLARSRAKVAGSALYAFCATEGPETGYWVVSPSQRLSRRGREDDRPAVQVEANAAVLLLFLTGGLDLEKAIADGVITVRGDTSALKDLAAFLREAK